MDQLLPVLAVARGSSDAAPPVDAPDAPDAPAPEAARRGRGACGGRGGHGARGAQPPPPEEAAQSDHSVSPGDEPEDEGGEEVVRSRSPSVESQASSVALNKHRAKKTSYSLDAEVEKALMEWIKENQILWNSKLILFKRTDMKEAL